MNFPPHKCGLFLTHNEHRDYYEPLADWIKEQEERSCAPVWDSYEAKQRAIATDECWVLQWYPNTPVSFHIVAAPTLEELLELAGECED